MKKIPHIDVKVLIEDFFAKKEYRTPTTLCALMTSFGSDKGMGHNYSTLYSKLFHSWKNEEIHLFEIGMGSKDPNIPSNMSFYSTDGFEGGSLLAWEAYFSKGRIFGADIDKAILFHTNRIKTFFCDQTSKDNVDELFNLTLKGLLFDIIIDDALHEYDANYTFLVNSLGSLKKGGVFIVEDVNKDTTLKFAKAIPDLKQQFNLAYFNIIELPHPENREDNVLVVLQK